MNWNEFAQLSPQEINSTVLALQEQKMDSWRDLKERGHRRYREEYEQAMALLVSLGES